MALQRTYGFIIFYNSSTDTLPTTGVAIGTKAYDITGSDGVYGKSEYTESGWIGGWGNYEMINDHIDNTSNPHSVTPSQIGAFPEDGGYLDGTLTIRNDEPKLGLQETDTNTRGRIIVSNGSLYLQSGANGAGVVQSNGNIYFTGLMGGNVLDFQIQKNNQLYDIWHAGNFDPSTKEDSLGLGTAGQLLATNDTGTGKEWIDAPVTGGDMYKSTYDTNDSGVVDDSEKLGGQDPSYYATQGSLDGHIGDTENPHNVTAEQTDAFATGEFINVSTGTPDAFKPITLDGNGRIDVSMLDTSTFYYVGNWDPSDPDGPADDGTGCDPTDGCEYPDTAGESAGAFWAVHELSAANDGDGYIFQGGELAGKRITVGDFMVWGTGGWGIMVGEMNPLLYYKLDGTQAITGSFAGGGQQFKNAANGTEATDLITLGQANADYAPIIHTHPISDITDLQAELDGKEDDLGNPTVDGYILSSTTSGDRSWIEPPTGDGEVPAGGLEGDILAKDSANNYDMSWRTPRGVFVITLATWAELVALVAASGVLRWDKYYVTDVDKELEIKFISPDGSAWYEEINDAGIVTLLKVE